MARILLGMPSNGITIPGVVPSVLTMSDGRHEIEVMPRSFSILTANFNCLWERALNERDRWDYFAMLHSDVVPHRLWLDDMVAEAIAERADVLSAVIPIKSDEVADAPATSTGVIDLGSAAQPIHTIRRLTLEECHAAAGVLRGKSFGIAEVIRVLGVEVPRAVLLVNSGLLLIDLRKSWVESIVWHQTDMMHKHPNGRREAKWISEDWNFSIDAAALGAKVMATTCVTLRHYGLKGWSNAEDERLRPADPRSAATTF